MRNGFIKLHILLAVSASSLAHGSIKEVDADSARHTRANGSGVHFERSGSLHAKQQRQGAYSLFLVPPPRTRPVRRAAIKPTFFPLGLSRATVVA